MWYIISFIAGGLVVGFLFVVICAVISGDSRRRMERGNKESW